MLPTIRSYLKLYTTLPLAKLAAFMSAARGGGERDAAREHAALAIHLLCFKHKMKNVVWTKGPSGLDGKFQSGSEVCNDSNVIFLTAYFIRWLCQFISYFCRFQTHNILVTKLDLVRLYICVPGKIKRCLVFFWPV